MTTDPDSGLTKGVAEQLAYLFAAVHAGRFDDAGVHHKLAQVQFFEGIAGQLKKAVDAVMLVALRTMREPAGAWRDEVKP